MFWPFSMLSVGKYAFGPSASSKRQRRPARSGRLRLEVLEDRTVLSTWVPKGPASITDPSNISGLGAQLYSGRITGLAADPTDANTLYIAAAGGGVWKTTDGGSDWTPLTDDQSTLFMGAIAVAPGTDINHRILYAGTGESNNSGDSFYGRGVLVSKDSGTTWTLTGSSVFDRRAIGKVVIDPTDVTGDTAYVAVSGRPANGTRSGFTGNYGIWKTTNGGTTWTNTTARIVNPSDFNPFTDLVMDSGDPKILYAAVGDFLGGLSGEPGGAANNGVYKTTNAGASWTLLTSFPDWFPTGRITLAIADVGTTTTLYASVSDPLFDATLGIAKSTNGGVSWNLVMTQLSSNYINYMGDQGWYDQTLIVDPNDPTGNTVYAAGAADPDVYPLDSIIKTTNGGRTWTDISVGTDGNEPHVDHHAIGFDAQGRLLDGNDGGIWRLDNPNVDSIQWTDLNGNLQITQFTGIALHPTDPNIVFGGSQDNGTEVFTGSSAWNLIQYGDGGFVRIDPNNPQTVYHTFLHLPLQRSDNGGTTWVDKTKGINLKDPAIGYPPFVMDPSNSSRLLLGTDRVYETTNGADSWKAISNPKTKGWVSSDPIDCLAIATSDGKTIYASAGGLIFVTTNDGSTWQKYVISGVSDGIADLVVDPDNSQIAYAVRNVFGGGHVFRTTNGGTTWTNISGKLPDLPTNTIVLGAGDLAGALYVGNDDGVYISTDLGATWSRLGDGLPNAQVTDLALNPNLGILAAATHGRGLWELSLGGVAKHLLITPSANSVTAGSALLLMITAVDDQNHPITDYTGTVHFTRSDSDAMLPNDSTFTAADAGIHTFDVTLVTVGSQTITVTDTLTGITITVTTPAASPGGRGRAPGASGGVAPLWSGFLPSIVPAAAPLAIL